MYNVLATKGKGEKKKRKNISQVNSDKKIKLSFRSHPTHFNLTKSSILVDLHEMHHGKAKFLPI